MRRDAGIKLTGLPVVTSLVPALARTRKGQRSRHSMQQFTVASREDEVIAVNNRDREARQLEALHERRDEVLHCQRSRCELILQIRSPPAIQSRAQHWMQREVISRETRQTACLAGTCFKCGTFANSFPTSDCASNCQTAPTPTLIANSVTSSSCACIIALSASEISVDQRRSLLNTRRLEFCTSSFEYASERTTTKLI